MPLSEDDQRVFTEIERSFYAQDPGFNKRVAKTARAPRRVSHVRLAVAGIVVGLVTLVVFFAQAAIVGFFGFLLALFCGAIVVDHLRAASRGRIESMTDSFNQRRDAAAGTTDRIRNPFKR